MVLLCAERFSRRRRGDETSGFLVCGKVVSKAKGGEYLWSHCPMCGQSRNARLSPLTARTLKPFFSFRSALSNGIRHELFHFYLLEFVLIRLFRFSYSHVNNKVVAQRLRIIRPFTNNKHRMNVPPTHLNVMLDRSV